MSHITDAFSMLMLRRENTWTLLPGRERWVTYLYLGLLLDILFIVIYGGTNFINHSRYSYLSLYFPWEVNLPFIPAFVYPYFSIVALFILPPFALDVSAMRRLARQLVVATLVAGAVFILLPTQLGFSRSEDAVEYSVLFDVLYTLDLPHNLFPSLHVIYSTILVLNLATASPKWVKTVLLFWLILMCMSVVLIHQHHLSDIVGGLSVALAIYGIMETRVQCA